MPASDPDVRLLEGLAIDQVAFCSACNLSGWARPAVPCHCAVGFVRRLETEGFIPTPGPKLRLEYRKSKGCIIPGHPVHSGVCHGDWPRRDLYSIEEP